MDSQQLLQENHTMLKSAAWNCFQSYGVEYEEVLSQSYLIFMEALEKYDSGKGAKFSSYLFSRLRTLADYCKKETRYKNRAVPLFSHATMQTDEVVYEYEIENEALIDPYWTKFCQVLEMYESMSELSADAKLLYKSMLNGECYEPGLPSKPNLTKITRIMRGAEGWMPARTSLAWRELEYWFNNSLTK